MVRPIAASAPNLQRLHDAETLARTLPPLLVNAQRVAETVAQGVHGRRRVGAGHSFWQFRPYLAGDSAARIDWRETAKSERAFIREQEWDAAQSVWLWADPSPSMAWRSSPRLPSKSERAHLLTLAVGAVLLRAGERIALLDSGRPAQIGRPVLHRMALDLEQQSAETSGAGGMPPERRLPRHASVVLIGDFLDPLETLRPALEKLMRGGVKGHLLQVLDPAEEDLPYSGRVHFQGLEAEPNLLVRRTEDIREAYHRKLEDHREALRNLTQRVGWSFTTHRTDHSAQAALLSLWAILSGNASGQFRAIGLS